MSQGRQKNNKAQALRNQEQICSSKNSGFIQCLPPVKAKTLKVFNEHLLSIEPCSSLATEKLC